VSGAEPRGEHPRPLRHVDPLDREAFDALKHGQDWFTRPVELIADERLVKFAPVTYMVNRGRYSNGGAYLTNIRLLYHPSAIQWDRPRLEWSLDDIESVGPFSLPWNVLLLNLLQFLPSRGWPVAGWYVQSLGKTSYFWIKRSNAADWIAAVSDATGKPVGALID
jgi:hypothetical protein